MIKKFLVIILFFSLFLTACSKIKVINFVGKSSNWDINYGVTVLDEDSESTNITIKYIGKDPIPKKITYSIETVSGKSSGNEPLTESGVLKGSGGGCDGCSVVQENEEINAIITWNGKSETFKLKNK
ncbi:hypothetical protein [Heyndrickxia vini]|uniref:Lipoprotein n=1 Tax=Heyndrickxia vini TaxID=1476025 RepID=A0ABX7E3N6_9BACI|nr:hypothetical protein [Heyndrickxia vini]QQZ09928.1 hypothetical protein I5776_02845 [Heyndrickxia vini]